MTKLYYDTETTGLIDFKKPLLHPSQPRMVQLAALLEDEEGGIISEYNVIVEPDGFEIPVQVSKIHGITQEIAIEKGRLIYDVLDAFFELIKRTDIIIAHNTSYDDKIIEIELLRLGEGWNTEYIDEFKSIPRYCTKEESTNILKLPGRYGYKWPTLDEAYRVLVAPEGFSGAHDALNDVKACREVYHKLMELKGGNETTP